MQLIFSNIDNLKISEIYWEAQGEFVKYLYCSMNQFYQDTDMAFTWSKLTIETLEQGVKYVQS